MNHHAWRLGAIVLILALGGLLVLAACSKPTAAPGGGYPGPLGATSEAQPGYPRAATAVPTAVPEGYIEPALRVTPSLEATP